MIGHEPFIQPHGVLQKIGFFIKHETTSGLANKARFVCLKNQEYLKVLVMEGGVTIEQLTEIGQDPDIREKYSKIMKDIRSGHDSTAQVLSLPYDQLGAWFIFFRDFYEKHWNIKLLTEEERTLPSPKAPFA